VLKNREREYLLEFLFDPKVYFRVYNDSHSLLIEFYTPMGLLKIGELAKRSSVSVESLRFYESEQLLSPQGRSNAGYRLYSSIDEQKLSFILHAKKVGFSLHEIKTLLSLRADKNSHTCEEVKSYTGAKVDEIDKKINDLQKMKHALENLYTACCGGNESAENCTILNSLDDPDLFTPPCDDSKSNRRHKPKASRTI